MCVKLDMITDIEMLTMIKEILNILIVDMLCKILRSWRIA